MCGCLSLSFFVPQEEVIFTHGLLSVQGQKKVLSLCSCVFCSWFNLLKAVSRKKVFCGQLFSVNSILEKLSGETLEKQTWNFNKSEIGPYLPKCIYWKFSKYFFKNWPNNVYKKELLKKKLGKKHMIPPEDKDGAGPNIYFVSQIWFNLPNFRRI